MEEYKSPVYNVISVPIDKVVANTYNPNVVAPPEMKLLEISLLMTTTGSNPFSRSNIRWDVFITL